MRNEEITRACIMIWTIVSVNDVVLMKFSIDFLALDKHMWFKGAS
jgi:hypothetical protein